MGWGQGGGTEPSLREPCRACGPQPRVVPGRCQDAAGGSAGEQPAMREPLSRFLSQRVGRSRCGQRCPLTVTFKALFPPAHEPQRSQPPATGPVPAGGRGGRIRPGSPLLTPGPGCRRQRGGPLGLVRSSCPPPAWLRSQGLFALLRCRIWPWGPAPLQRSPTLPALPGQDAAPPPPGWIEDPRGGPGDVPKPRLSILGLASHQPSPSCQPSVMCHRGRAQHIYPELI